MGTGKTVVGRRLAAALDREFYDTDAEVEREAGLKIPEIFARYGEPYFRALEARAVVRVCAGAGRVIATGGGAVLNPESAVALRRSGTVVWLTAAPEVIFRRLGGQDGRPLLPPDAGLERIRELLARREPSYRACAHFAVDTSDLSVDQVVQEILRLLPGRGVAGGAAE